MTGNVINHNEVKKTNAAAGASLFRDIFAASKPRVEAKDGLAAFAGKHVETPEIKRLVNLIDRHAVEKDGWSRCMGATIALLKYAHKMIERAESVMRSQEARIQQLEALLSTDELTEINNRRGFFEAFHKELDKCARGHVEGGLLVLIDLDNFKMINDTYGHQAGDACLKLVADCLQSEIRTMDVAARLGGDEFVLLLSNTSKESAAGRAQKLAWQLNHLSLAWNGEEIPVRASLGLRAYGAGDKADDIFSAADMAMYANKNHKKTRKVSGPIMQPS